MGSSRQLNDAHTSRNPIVRCSGRIDGILTTLLTIVERTSGGSLRTHYALQFSPGMKHVLLFVGDGWFLMLAIFGEFPYIVCTENIQVICISCVCLTLTRSMIPLIY